MKILLFLMILFLVSCGPKSESTKAKFKIFSGHSADLATAFKGGILIMGRSADGAQSFILSYQPDLELNLNKGEWEFATIGWTGGPSTGSTGSLIFYPIEGRQQCSHQIVNVNSDNFTVNFKMSYGACKFVASDGSYFTDPKFYYSGSDSDNKVGFKKLQVIDSATIQNPPSFRVEIPTKLRGITTNTVMGTPLRSRCVPSSSPWSLITPPHGGANGVVDIIVTTFSNANCTENPVNYPFEQGTGQGNLSVNLGANSDQSADLAEATFYGDYFNTSAPPETQRNKKALYIYRGPNDQEFSWFPGEVLVPGEYLYYNGSQWSTFMESDSVKLFLPIIGN